MPSKSVTHLALTEFEAEQVIRALKKRAQCLRAAQRRQGQKWNHFKNSLLYKG